jgi:putative glutamine amidotransferase
MERPLIGITTDYNDQRNQYAEPFAYAQAVELAGGLPVMLPFAVPAELPPQYAEVLDGVLFSGGSDLDPAGYGQAWHPQAVHIDPRREAFERSLLDHAERRRLPILGICLGCQLLNVHRGGSLHQFLPDVPRENPIEHRRTNDWSRRHAVKLDEGSRLARWLGKRELSTNTSHKQGVDRLGRGLTATGRAPDGVVEVIEDQSLPFYIGVQWHPERQHDEPDHLGLFEELVKAARKPAAQ